METGPNVWHQRRAKRVRCMPGLGRDGGRKDRGPRTRENGMEPTARVAVSRRIRDRTWAEEDSAERDRHHDRL